MVSQSKAMQSKTRVRRRLEEGSGGGDASGPAANPEVIHQARINKPSACLMQTPHLVASRVLLVKAVCSFCLVKGRKQNRERGARQPERQPSRVRKNLFAYEESPAPCNKKLASFLFDSHLADSLARSAFRLR